MRILRLFVLKAGVIKQNIIDFTTKDTNPQGFVCLSGVNGSGKTTVMELTYNMVKILDPEFGNTRFSVDNRRKHVFLYTEFAQLDILFEGNLLSIVIGDEQYIQKDSNYEQMIVIDNDIKEIIRQWEFYIKDEDLEGLANTEERRRRFEEIQSLASKRKLQVHNNNVYPDLLDKIKLTLKEPIQGNEDLLNLYYFPVNSRIILDKRHKTIPKYKWVDYSLAHKFDPNSDDLNSILVYFDYAYQDLFNKLVKWINNNVLVDKKIKGVNRPEFKAVVITKSGDEHGLESLSSGEESMLNLAVHIFLNARKNSVFLVDEVDESLHPEFQTKLINLLKSIQYQSDCQLIISSHSPYVWNTFNNNDQAMIRLTEVIK